ncbi:MAG: ABC transporter substrate-binding protein [Alphaproteobacteria bacterium 16-39-46]|nr:MAG: ABC transporter substrate-binding protein [Alphaproteobacteria bacterium 16-39-46]OZA42282.1 MAG: ABC transporter substrate-binding protein [Alphaproteobacteria bacterium 17-39-52]HQS84049.1 ABC transporter substrate-binding protein [Alphaproteobacteria bacterium]HQS93911.1 ABC transporter substrate-binding protein [Alphaproteobacteria bacterium]
MRRLTLFLGLLLLTSDVFATSTPTSSKTVLISQVALHPALNITVKGIIDALEKKGFKQGENINIRSESAQSSFALASQISVKFLSQTPDVIVGVGTISAQSISKYAQEKRCKLIFSSVTDPVEANLIKSLTRPDNNTSGVSNFVPLEPQLDLFQKLQPSLKRLGVLYNPGESNSVSILKKLEVLCSDHKIILVKQTATKTSDVAQAAVKLAHQVDAIFISNDSTALSSLQSIIQAANKVKIPVYVSDTDAVQLGALAALGPNQYDVGLQTGDMIARVLKGENVAEMPVEFPKKIDLYLNAAAAKLVGITLPETLKREAAKLIETSS